MAKYFSLYYYYFPLMFLFTYFPYACILALPSPFQKQPSTRRCTPCCELRDPFLTRNASFEICNPRRSWHVMTLSETRGGQGIYLPPSSDLRTQAKLWLYLMLGENKFWFCIAPRWLPQVTSFPTGMSPRTMQHLGSV